MTSFLAWLVIRGTTGIRHCRTDLRRSVVVPVDYIVNMTAIRVVDVSGDRVGGNYYYVGLT